MRLADLALLNAEYDARRAVALVTDLPAKDKKSSTQRVVRAADVEDDPLGGIIAEHLRAGRSGTLEHDGREVFIAVRVPPVRLLLVGAVHISQALAPMAAMLGLDVTVLDPRTAFADPKRFPNVPLLPAWPDDALPAYALDAFTAVALLTHEPRIDDQALVAALRAPCFYIGALGSRKTHARRCERMAEQGFAQGDLDRIHAPIGLDIAAVSPAEIAVSVLAQIVAARRRKPMRAAACLGA